MDTTIMINRVNWSVFFVDDTCPELKGEDDQQYYGITFQRECEIYIDRTLPATHMQQIITHELMHAFAFAYRESINCESEERICDFVAAHLDELNACREEILKSI